MFGFLKNIFSKKEKNILAAIDIGSSLIKTIIIDTSNKKIIGSAENNQKIGSIKNGNIYNLKAVIESVSECLNKAEDKAGASVDYIAFGLSGDFDNFTSKTFKAHLQTIADEIGGKFVGAYSLATTYPFGVYGNKNYIIVDIGANNTSVSLVKDGCFKKTENFFLGGNLFTKTVARIFTISFEEAEKIKILFSIGKLKDSILTEKDFKSDLDLWMTAFFVSLKNFGEKKLPNTVYIAGAGSLFFPLTDKMKSEKLFYKQLNFNVLIDLKQLDSGLYLNKGKKIENTAPWVPVRLFGEFLTKIDFGS